MESRNIYWWICRKYTGTDLNAQYTEIRIDRVSYKLSEREIEGYSYPGVASTMKGLLTYPSEYNSRSQFIWGLDSGKAMGNKGFVNRRKFYWNRDNVGKFSVILPLDHMFGFYENYRKVTYGLKHVLTLRGNHNNDAIIKSAAQGEISGEARDKVTDGKIDIKKIYSAIRSSSALIIFWHKKWEILTNGFSEKAKWENKFKRR